MKESVKSIKIIYTALMIGVGLFLLLVSAMVFTNIIEPEVDLKLLNILEICSTIIAAVLIYAGIIIFIKQRELFLVLPDREKIEKYRSAMIIRAATMEGSALFFIICFMLTGHFLLLSEALVCLVIMAVFFPSNTRISNETNIDFNQFV